LAEGLRFAAPSAFEALHSSGSLEVELAQEFAAMDTNGDGKITLDEFKAALSTASSGSHQPGPWDLPLDASKRLDRNHSCKS
jgi:hypothetical protein